MPDLDAIRERITAALDGSIDRCARCKVCDNQIDAVMAVIAETIGQPPEGTVTEWGVRFDGPPPYHPELSAYDTEGEARHQAEITPAEGGWSATLMRRQVGPWTEVPETGPREDENP